MSNRMKKILKHYNGWIGFVLATLLFFVSPPLYRLVDPTAGQFDAGYIHPVLYAAVVVCFASGLAFLLVRFTAPGVYDAWDKFLDGDSTSLHGRVAVGLGLYGFYMVMICLTVWAVV